MHVDEFVCYSNTLNLKQPSIYCNILAEMTLGTSPILSVSIITTTRSGRGVNCIMCVVVAEVQGSVL